ncbi:MAG TPA: class II glutamine amidotransferase [Acidimicrobiales bacterium]|jgi:predicted glutamine amidotransferase
MCRLLGFVARDPLGVSGAIGEQQFDEYVSLSRLHRDGWGFAASSSEDVIGVYRSPVRALDDPRVENIRRDRSTSGLVHLRWASLGLPVREENSHPFVADYHGPLAFAHNGSVAQHAAIEPLLDEEQRAIRRGDTDSELYFLLFLQSLNRRENVADALRETIETIRVFAPVASLNAMVLSGEELHVVHSHSGMNVPTADLIESCGSLAEAPPAHADHYFDLSWSESDGVVSAAHTGLSGDWETLPPDSLLSVRRSDLTTSVTAL